MRPSHRPLLATTSRVDVGSLSVQQLGFCEVTSLQGDEPGGSLPPVDLFELRAIQYEALYARLIE